MARISSALASTDRRKAAKCIIAVGQGRLNSVAPRTCCGAPLAGRAEGEFEGALRWTSKKRRKSSTRP
jgi:hypothetical protein